MSRTQKMMGSIASQSQSTKLHEVTLRNIRVTSCGQVRVFSWINCLATKPGQEEKKLHVCTKEIAEAEAYSE